MSAILVDRVTGHRSIAAYYGTIGGPSIDRHVERLCRSAQWFLATWTTLAGRRSRRYGPPASVRQVSVDHGNPTPGLDLSMVQLYAPTEARLRERFPAHDLRSAMSAASRDGPRLVAVTRGDSGSIGAEAAGIDGPRFATAPAFTVDVVSTLGAGDVFHGALLAALVDGLDLESALRRANAAAALCCRSLDGRTSIPTRAELDAFLEAGSPADPWSDHMSSPGG